MNADLDFIVLVNAEGQHSIWPEMKAVPKGWKQIGPAGTQEEVLQWIRENWTNLQPARFRAS